MAFVRSSPPKKRSALKASWPAPIAGWIKNRALAIPEDGPQGAEILDNFFPTAQGATLRRGYVEHATCGEDSDPVLSLFTYDNGVIEKMFAATTTDIWDVTTAGAATSVVDTLTNGLWSVQQFATAGGVFLVCVNGNDEALLFDGTTWSATTIAFPALSTLTTADLIYVWNYANRLYFVQKESMDVWYLPVDTIGGTLTLLPLGGVFPRGGSLVFGETWSLDAGASGGLSEQCIFISTEGEVAVYQGTNPSSATTWSKVGLYRIGSPLGPRAWVRGGGDIIVGTRIGMVTISKAIQMDAAALSPVSVTYPIEEAWNDETSLRGYGWQAVIWTEGQMMLIVPPYIDAAQPFLFVANARTGAWAPWYGWDVRCIATFQGALYFGTTDGFVRNGYVSGLDGANTFTGKYLPLFTDAEAPGAIKIAGMVMHTVRANTLLSVSASCQFDFDTTLPAPGDSIPATGEASLWGVGLWGSAVWSSGQSKVVSARWQSVGGSGYFMAPSLQVTSGATAPIDLEIVQTDMTYQVAEIVT